MSNKAIKETFRTKFRQIRDKVPTSVKEEAEKNAAKIFLENISLSPKNIVSAYYPANNELGTLELLKQLASKGITTCLPVIKGKDLPLDFKKWQYGDKLIQSSFFKLQEPDGEVVKPDIIIVPFIAFDKKLNRLGYGGGFYDKTLKNLKSTGNNFTSIGYGYSFQQEDELPTGENDVPLDYVITEERIIRRLNQANEE
ncbi:MAG: 5-formyltetrahydrofolate cyclo-ligase [Rickettsiales bacterium]|nr:5-formyltetrahydrofolate cyclo-ligase [Pseudomonadota bacterium]MDA0965631.1 5-formyltetrahydrofolate cyclo-ligase [Pseudomonadota bacterium]MDG4542955.1 5-formyltetrahydrofolate cyclo-ligase [Rickettsiales bacterium]MDG4544597.1 5-formyltetrahydrofolate cyclo-ligase [Rickettsiales bacterium]MDG4546719.1 5-formyltetrahydrofolate cyclo-ligase [Rickettsiales bacterium]